MKSLLEYIIESKESRAIEIIDRIATKHDDGKDLSSGDYDNLLKALNILKSEDSFEDGWIEIAQNILDSNKQAFKELVIDCKFAKGKMFDYADRKIVLLDINGIALPFYCSTGYSGKEKQGIPSGQWYPFFGLRTNHSKYGKIMKITNVGWLRKGTSQLIKDFYGSTILKLASEYLNSKYGNVVGKSGIPVVPEYKEDEEKFNLFANAINKDLVKLVGGEDNFADVSSIDLIASNFS